MGTRANYRFCPLAPNFGGVYLAPQPPILGEHEPKIPHLLPLCKEILISPAVSTLGEHILILINSVDSELYLVVGVEHLFLWGHN
jgi:hypothetical protein